jgi:hypothetical protein
VHNSSSAIASWPVSATYDVGVSSWMFFVFLLFLTSLDIGVYCP